MVLGSLVERRIGGAATAGQAMAHVVGAGGSRAFSPPLPEMTRYNLTPGGLVKVSTEGAATW